ncbi:MAG: hypothetical protein ABJC04_09430, partial [Verrucomicrobiota bacterium]
LREIGATFGTSDDTAQKRVSRAVEKLREFFTKRGVTIGASGLVVVITANAVQAAPIGMALTISAATLAGTITTTTLTTHTTMNWITAKTVSAILGSALVAGTGTYLLQQRETNRLRNENQNLIAAQANQQNSALSATPTNSDELERLRKEKNELIRLRSEVGILREQVSEVKKLREENRQIRAALVEVSKLSEDELKLLEFEAHQASTVNAMKQLGLALRLYAQDHNNQYATNFDQMKNEIPPKFPGHVGLDAFEFVNAGLVNETMLDIITFRERIPSRTPAGTWERVYTLADGSVQKIESPDGNFDEFEKPRMVPLPK